MATRTRAAWGACGVVCAPCVVIERRALRFGCHRNRCGERGWQLELGTRSHALWQLHLALQVALQLSLQLALHSALHVWMPLPLAAEPLAAELVKRPLPRARVSPWPPGACTSCRRSCRPATTPPLRACWVPTRRGARCGRGERHWRRCLSWARTPTWQSMRPCAPSWRACGRRPTPRVCAHSWRGVWRAAGRAAPQPVGRVRVFYHSSATQRRGRCGWHARGSVIVVVCHSGCLDRVTCSPCSRGAGCVRRRRLWRRVQHSSPAKN